MTTVLTVFGTRPEAIKLAPVIRELQQRPGFRCIVCVTGQHRSLLDQVLEFFGVPVDHDLRLMVANQTLGHVVSAALVGVERVIGETDPAWVLVQGDTATTMAAGIAGYFGRRRVAHVEAGLRTYNRYSPFPEEVNRRVTAVVTDLHCAPTEDARANLLKEGVPDETIVVTGNTVIDALLWTRDQVTRPEADTRYRALFRNAVGVDLSAARVITVTGHRRESFGPGFVAICQALGAVADRFPDAHLVYPVHPNPNVRTAIATHLGARDNIHLVEPLPYDQFVWLLNASHLVLTDSGGVQEEAPYLGKPVLVMRDHTERDEVVRLGGARLVGTDADRIVQAVSGLMDDRRAYEAMRIAGQPYGAGRASQVIVDALERFGA